MNIINTNIDNIDLFKIKIKKPTNLGNKKVFKIYYKFQNEYETEFVIQTPDLIIPYGKLQSQDKDEIVFDCCNDQFIDKLLDIRDYIVKKIYSSDNSILNNKIEIRKVLQKEYGKVLRLKISNAENICIFDQNSMQLTPEALHKDRKIQLILNIKWFWISKEFYGIEYSVIQIKVYMPPTNNMFSSEVIKNEELNEELYQKYRKMLKLKIPLGAVKSKMLLDGLSNDEILEFEESVNNKSKQEPEIAQPIKAVLPSNPLSFLNEIAKGGFKLRTVNKEDLEEKKKRDIMNKLSKFVDTSRKVPTLDDIISAKSRLKKI
jgi:hypothetical protein